MIRTLFLILLAGLLNIASAQDVITLINGDSIKAKVIEVDLKVVRYKKFENLNGPSYLIEKNAVAMIVYENGSKDKFNESIKSETGMTKMDDTISNRAGEVWRSIPETQKKIIPVTSSSGEELRYSKGKIFQNNIKVRPAEVKYKMHNDSEALRLYRSGRTMSTVGTVFQIVGLADLALSLAYSMQGYTEVTRNVLIATAEIGIGVMFSSSGGNLKGISVKKFNAGLKMKNLSSLNFGITPNGVGLCVRF